MPTLIGLQGAHLVKRNVTVSFGAALFLAAASLSFADAVRAIAVNGQQAPGTPTGSLFDTFRSPVLNDGGNVAFHARLTIGTGDVTPTTTTGIWSEGAGNLALVARSGMLAPGTNAGQTFDLEGNPDTLILNDAGQVAIKAPLQLDFGGVTPSNQLGIWLQRNNDLTLIARLGDQAPAAPIGAVFNALSAPAFNNSGYVAFNGRLKAGTGGIDSFNDRGVWSDGNGSMRIVAREGDLAPGLSAGSLFGDALGDPSLNHVGDAAFTAVLQSGTGGVTSTNAPTIWREQSGILGLVARGGSQAPGAPGGTNFVDFSSTSINDADKLVFTGVMTGAGTILAPNNGVWSDSSGSLALVARQGTTIPGATNSERFNAFTTTAINAAGKVAFLASYYTGSSNSAIFAGEGIWSNVHGALQLVARDGIQATGAVAGQNFDFTNANSFFLNSKGQVAFGARVNGRSGVWAQDINGLLRPIAIPGDVLDIDNGPGIDLRTITSATLFADTFNAASGNSDGRSSAFNDVGQIVFMASFSDGSRGVFVSNLVAIPEPATLVIVAPPVFAFVIRHRKRVPASGARDDRAS
jgi:hypothetical protein